jgi:hypothetical protein
MLQHLTNMFSNEGIGKSTYFLWKLCNVSLAYYIYSLVRKEKRKFMSSDNIQYLCFRVVYHLKI